MDGSHGRMLCYRRLGRDGGRRFGEVWRSRSVCLRHNRRQQMQATRLWLDDKFADRMERLDRVEVELWICHSRVFEKIWRTSCTYTIEGKERSEGC